ncbi:hypothetical protein BDV93DRAFT_317636 [Ceratobasidium sp. AG-I]|nr:hypothetical protein BDV93DRAFT_317636 [Ceratobasidium sp. AG-I]
MTSSGLNNKWGPTLPIYLAAASSPDFEQATNARRNVTSNRTARATMEDFLARTHSFVSVSVLEKVLSLARKPANLTEFGNTGMIPACMRMLRHYTQNDKKLFRRHYGIMCLDLLLLSFQVGMITQRGQLRAYAKQWTSQNVPGEDMPNMLSTYALVAIYDTLYGENGTQDLASLLGWDRTSTCLPLSGGFSGADALYLLDTLWEDRESFVVIGTSNLLSRYISILFVLWHSMLRMDRVSEELWGRLYTLVYRYYLFADRVEAVSLHKIAFHLDQVIDKDTEVLPKELLNPDDSRNIVEAYIRRLTLEPTGSEVLHVSFATCFYDFVFENVTEDVQDLIPRLLEASMVRLWSEFEDNSPMRPRITYVIKYAARTFQWAELIRDAMTVEAYKSLFAQVLLEQDLFNLVVRSLFILYTQEIGHPLDPSVLEEVATDWELLIHSITFFSRAEGSPPLVQPILFQNLYPDWVKVLTYFELLKYTSGVVPHLPGHLLQIEDSLSEVGMALGFQHGQELGPLCQSPRCPSPNIGGGAHFACSRCLEATYCSERCSNSHWLLDYDYSHKSECTGAVQKQS